MGAPNMRAMDLQLHLFFWRETKESCRRWWREMPSRHLGSWYLDVRLEVSRSMVRISSFISPTYKWGMNWGYNPFPNHLLVWWLNHPIEKKMRKSIWIISPSSRGENQKKIYTTTNCSNTSPPVVDTNLSRCGPPAFPVWWEMFVSKGL